MADIYAVVDKSKKKNRSPCKEESTVGGAFMSPLYDAVEADLESRSVPVDNQGPDAEYSVLARDGVYPRVCLQELQRPLHMPPTRLLENTTKLKVQVRM